MNSRLFVCACALAILSARSEAADIGDLSLEQLMDLEIESVYGASLYEQRVTQAPSSISIVTAEDIRRFGYTNFQDILRGVRGLYVNDDRNYSYLGIRGFNRPGDYNTRVLVLVDGHRLNENIYDSGSIGRDSMLDVELIERVEIVRGPSSSVYGSSAFLGVINVVTKRGQQLDGVEIAQEVGSFDTYKTSATYGTTFTNGVDWIASATHYSSGGADLYYPEFDQRISDNPLARENGLAIGLDGEEATKFFTSVRTNNLSATAYLSERTKELPTAPFDTMFASPESWTKDQRGYVDVAMNGALGAGISYHARAAYDYFRYLGSSPSDWALPGDPPDVVITIDDAIGEWISGEFHLKGMLWPNSTFLVGTEYRVNLREDQFAYDDLQPRVYTVHDMRSSRVFGAFTQVETKLLDSFTFIGGLRYDRYSDGLGNTLNPRIAAIYNPTSRSAFKLLYGEAFRAPNPYERYYFLETQQTRPTLSSETIHTYEAVYEHYFGNRYRFNVSAYQYDVHGLITQAETDTGLWYYDNIDHVDARGVALELEAKLASGLLTRASYVLQRSTDHATRSDLTSSPRHLGKLNVSVPIKGSMFANLELQYHSKSRTLAGAESPDFTLTNLSFTTATLWPHVELSASIYNVLNANHVYPAAEEHAQDTLQQNGRTYQGKLVVRF